MKTYKNIVIIAMLFSALLACSENKEKQEKNTQKKNVIFSEKLSENFQYTDSPDLSEEQKSLLQTYDISIKEPLQKAILENINNANFPSNIEQTAFNNGFVKSALIFINSEHAFDLLSTFLSNNTDVMDFSDDELQSICTKIIKFGHSQGIFDPIL